MAQVNPGYFRKFMRLAFYPLAFIRCHLRVAEMVASNANYNIVNNKSRKPEEDRKFFT